MLRAYSMLFLNAFVFTHLRKRVLKATFVTVLANNSAVEFESNSPSSSFSSAKTQRLTHTHPTNLDKINAVFEQQQ